MFGSCLAAPGPRVWQIASTPHKFQGTKYASNRHPCDNRLVVRLVARVRSGAIGGPVSKVMFCLWDFLSHVWVKA